MRLCHSLKTTFWIQIWSIQGYIFLMNISLSSSSTIGTHDNSLTHIERSKILALNNHYHNYYVGSLNVNDRNDQDVISSSSTQMLCFVESYILLILPKELREIE